jgi:hypothetical protein
MPRRGQRALIKPVLKPNDKAVAGCNSPHLWKTATSYPPNKHRGTCDIPCVGDASAGLRLSSLLQNAASSHSAAASVRPRIGLLECGICGQKFVLSGTNPSRYVCGSFTNGGEHACSNKCRVSPALAEDKLIQPVVAELLSPEAIALAEKELRRLHREHQAASTAQPGRTNGKLAKLDQQIVQVERLRAEGVLTEDIAAAAIAKANADRRDLAAADTAADSRELARVLKLLPRAAEAYRAQVAEVREALTDEKRVHRARVALRELLGGAVKLRPAPDAKYLIAEVGYTPAALLKAAGAQLWIGSGGAIIEPATTVRWSLAA